VRAREPDARGVVERDGVRVGYEVFEPLLGDTGTGRPTLVFLTSWAVIHMRQWKLQVPALARRFRVVTVEGRGNGAADRPIGPAPAVRCSSRPLIPAGSPAWWPPPPRCPWRR
jgi:hypothetical protein